MRISCLFLPMVSFVIGAAEKIRIYWEDLKELQRYRTTNYEFDGKRRDMLESKYEEVLTLFGKESSLSIAQIYYLSTLDK